MMLFTSLHIGLVPASEELRKLQEEGNLDDDGEEDEPSDEEHYESVDGENGVNEVDWLFFCTVIILCYAASSVSWPL